MNTMFGRVTFLPSPADPVIGISNGSKAPIVVENLTSNEPLGSI
jgi:hypothetical protein